MVLDSIGIFEIFFFALNFNGGNTRLIYRVVFTSFPLHCQSGIVLIAKGGKVASEKKDFA